MESALRVHLQMPPFCLRQGTEWGAAVKQAVAIKILQIAELSK